MAKEYIPVFFDWLDVTQDLTQEQKGNLIDAAILYATGGDYESVLTGVEKIAFRFIKGQIDRNSAISDARSKAGSSKKEQKESNEIKTEQNESNLPKEKEKEKENKNKEEKEIHPSDVQRKAERFSPPTVEQVRAYCQERKNNVDAERFCDFYASKGWKVGSQPMKDWKACVRTWERDDNRVKPALAPVSSKRPAVQDYEQRDYTQRESDLFRRSLQLAEAVGEGG